MICQRFKLPKSERINSRKIFRTVIKKGHFYESENVQCFYLSCNCAQSAWVVPQKKIKLSVDRHLIKRRMREYYRLNKNSLRKNYYTIFIYKNTKVVDFTDIERSMKECLEYLAQND